MTLVEWMWSGSFICLLHFSTSSGTTTRYMSTHSSIGPGQLTLAGAEHSKNGSVNKRALHILWKIGYQKLAAPSRENKHTREEIWRGTWTEIQHGSRSRRGRDNVGDVS